MEVEGEFFNDNPNADLDKQKDIDKYNKKMLRYIEGDLINKLCATEEDLRDLQQVLRSIRLNELLNKNYEYPLNKQEVRLN